MSSHKALSNSDWRDRLKKFAAGESLKRGQYPPKSSQWHVKFEMVKSGPLQSNRSGFDLFKNPVKCNCGYHGSASSTRSISTPSTRSISYPQGSNYKFEELR
eukprot:TCONS_00007761-protein